HHPQQTAYALEEARVLATLGVLYAQTAQPGRAVPAYEEATALLDKVTAASPAAGEPLLFQGRLYVNLAKLHEQAGHLQAAERAYLKARAAHERLRQAHPQRLDVQAGLVTVLGDLGALFQQHRQPALAMQYFEEAQRLLVELTRAQPQEPRFTLWLGQVYVAM